MSKRPNMSKRPKTENLYEPYEHSPNESGANPRAIRYESGAIRRYERGWP